MKVPKNNDASAEEKIYIVPKRKDELELSTTSCAVKEGCDFVVKSKVASDNMLLLSSK